MSIGAWYYGRTIKPTILLLVSAAATAWLNPQFVWGNVSWYLSFLAFVGILIVAPAVTRRVYGAREPKLFAQLIIECLCAEAMTMPYVLHIFGQTSLVALPANILIATFVPLAMLLCAVAGFGGMMVFTFAGWLAWPAKLVLTYMLDGAQLLSRVPHAFVENVGFSLTAMALSYVIIAFLTLIWWHRAPKNAIITDNNTANLKTEGAYLERTLQMVDN
jgi:hypothetical protein